MKRITKNILCVSVVILIAALFAVYIRFFNGSFIYISTGLGKNTILNAKNQKTSMYQADILMSDARKEYEDVFGSDIWNQNIDGVSFEDYAKEQIKTKLIRLRCMNIFAQQNGVVLSRSQKEDVVKAANEYMSKLSDSQKSTLGLTQDKAEKMFTEFAIAKTLYEDFTSSVDDEISADDARVINIQYIVCDNESDINEAKELVDSGEVFYSVVCRYNGSNDYECVLKRGQMDKAFETAAFDLKSGEVSKVVAADGRYYIIKCISDNEKSKTEANKTSIVDEKKLEHFNDKFEDFETSVYVEFNNKIWKQKKMASAQILDVDFESIFEKYFGK